MSDPGENLEPVGLPLAEPPQSEESERRIYVVVDSGGFAGAFATVKAAEAAVRPYSGAACILLNFSAAPGPCSRVWVVPFRGVDAVAFVSNDRAEAERVRGIYAKVGLVFDDDLDFWEQPFGVVPDHAARRLETQHRASQLCSGDLTAGDFEKMEAADLARVEAFAGHSLEDGPLARAIRENERISIIDCVVPVLLPTGRAEGVGEERENAEAASVKLLDAGAAADTEIPDRAESAEALDEH